MIYLIQTIGDLLKKLRKLKCKAKLKSVKTNNTIIISSYSVLNE